VTLEYYIPKRTIDTARKYYKNSLVSLEHNHNCLVHTNEYGRHVDYRVTFDTEEDYIWFMLRWS